MLTLSPWHLFLAPPYTLSPRRCSLTHCHRRSVLRSENLVLVMRYNALKRQHDALEAENKTLKASLRAAWASYDASASSGGAGATPYHIEDIE